MKTCFVMQVFDNAEYDTRFTETFAPALNAAGALPVRADKILGTKPIVEKIEAALREATIGFAEISENNPNVFIELGYALDQGLPLIMVCDRAKRPTLPFDIQHRPVIFYQTKSQGDFAKLSGEIEAAAVAALVEAGTKTAKEVGPEPSLVTDVDDLKNKIMLHIVKTEMGSPVGPTAFSIKNHVARAGFTEQLVSLAVLSLIESGYVQREIAEDRDGDPYTTYNLSPKGQATLLGQYADLKRYEDRIIDFSGVQSKEGMKASTRTSAFDDDPPF